MLMLTLSPYTIMAVPAVLSLGFGIWVFFFYLPTLLTSLGLGIILVILFIVLDLAYFVLSIWCGFRIMGVFKDIQKDWPPRSAKE